MVARHKKPSPGGRWQPVGLTDEGKTRSPSAPPFPCPWEVRTPPQPPHHGNKKSVLHRRKCARGTGAALIAGASNSAPGKPTSLVTFLSGDKKVTPPPLRRTYPLRHGRHTGRPYNHKRTASLFCRDRRPRRSAPPHPLSPPHLSAPSDEGKRSAVAVVNDSPVDCQSRDRAARRRLSKILDF